MPTLDFVPDGARSSLAERFELAYADADSRQTLLCTYLSGVLLLGLVLNSLFGWSWADPIVALVIAAVAVKKGREAWRGEHCR